ncbi:helix-turn-helix transcriptional regulator [Marivita sp. S2033]|uniref:helix-turn-helix transcriptional regulator n=1 Tax=Marivita sp. S2033 TaxID=3373187 RepID=UPI00398246A5
MLTSPQKDAQDTRPSKDVLLRLSQIIGDDGLLPVSRSTLYNLVKSGEIPKPVKLGPRISCWWKSDILAYVTSMEGDS